MSWAESEKGWETNPRVKYMFFLRFVKYLFTLFSFAHIKMKLDARTNSNLIKMVDSPVFPIVLCPHLFANGRLSHKIRSNRSNSQSCHIFYFSNLSSLFMHKHIHSYITFACSTFQWAYKHVNGIHSVLFIYFARTNTLIGLQSSHLLSLLTSSCEDKPNERIIFAHAHIHLRQYNIDCTIVKHQV